VISTKFFEKKQWSCGFHKRRRFYHPAYSIFFTWITKYIYL